MSPGITFRCTCEHCGTIFFGPDRNAATCMKCAKRYRIRTEQPPRQARSPEDDFLASALVAPAPARRPVTRPSAPTPPAVPPRPAETPGAASRPAHAPRITELTENARTIILQAYSQYEGREDLALRRIHSEIAEKTAAARSLVARVIGEVRVPPPTISEECRQNIIALYHGFVRRMARPAGGRRSTIARELGISRQQVAAVVREWAASQPSVTDLRREDLFRIECAYWTALEVGMAYDVLAQSISEALGYSGWQVERWMDMLHDGQFPDVEEPPVDQCQAVIAAYQEYLQGDGPPPKSLHNVLADRYGLAPKQVHKVLVAYRLARRQETFGF